jgi:hypothetical protein
MAGLALIAAGRSIIAAKGKAMSRETREIRRIHGAPGTITDKAGVVARVRFSLVQSQDFIDEIPMLKHASGTLQFENRADAWHMTSGPENKTLKGGGIEAQVLVLSEQKFSVTGPITDI